MKNVLSESADNLLFNLVCRTCSDLVATEKKTWTRLLHAENHSLFKLKSVRGSFCLLAQATGHQNRSFYALARSKNKTTKGPSG